MKDPRKTLIIEHTVYIDASPEAVWARMIDFKTWSEWDSEIQWVTLDQGVVVGSRGKLKTRGNFAVPFWITEVIPLWSYTSVAGIGPMKLVAEHHMEQTPKGISVTFSLSSLGWGSGLHRWMYGPMMRRGLPQWMENFKSTFSPTSSNADDREAKSSLL